MSVRVLAIVERAGACSLGELRHQLARRHAAGIDHVERLIAGGYLEVAHGDLYDHAGPEPYLKLTPAGQAALDAPPTQAQGDRRNGTRTASSDVQARHQAQL